MILRSVASVSNAGPRTICNLPACFRHDSTLTQIKSSFDICVLIFFTKTIVRWCGHCFRHQDHAIAQLLSLPLAERLRLLRSRGVVSELTQSAVSFWNSLSTLGLQVDRPIGGRPAVRGQSGFAFRWGEGWFEPIRDGGVGWIFNRNDEDEIVQRANILMRLYRPARNDEPLAIQDHALELVV